MGKTRRGMSWRSTPFTPAFESKSSSCRAARLEWRMVARTRRWMRLSSESWTRCRRISMYLGKVIGRVVSSAKNQGHEGKKLLLVQPLDLDDQPAGDIVVALDAVGAGVGDRVLAVQEGFSAMTAVGHSESPIDAAVVGVIDAVTLEEVPV